MKPTDDIGPLNLLLQISSGYWLSRCLHVVAEFGVADALDDTPRSVERLAEATGTHAGALGRVLRLLSSHGVFENRGGEYAHTPASRLLRTDHPQSVRPLVRMLGLPIWWKSYEHLDHAVQTGLPAVDKAAPGGMWSYFSKHPEARQIFDQAMAARAQGQIAGVVQSYSFGEYRVIGDIGGGRGHLLQAVLGSAPQSTGILFDLPQVVAQVSDLASERLCLQSGGFFKDTLPRCDIYLMMDVIHDWSDQEATMILKNLRRAAPPDANLLIIEAIVPEDSKPSWATMLDVQMLTMLTGRQRTQREHAQLLTDTGFRFKREVPKGNFSIIEATAA